MTAWGNDTAYERIFAEQLSPLIRPSDVVVAVSASGNSPNVVTAVELARLVGATTIALTGQTGGRLRRIADLTIRVSAGSIEQVEDAHLAIGHSLCVALRRRMRQPQTSRARKTPQLVEDQALLPAIADLIAGNPDFAADAATS
jgi:D-sedoheptulose 7-phosphate isomerase